MSYKKACISAGLLEYVGREQLERSTSGLYVWLKQKKEHLAQQRTKWGAVEGESWLLQQWEKNNKVQIFSDVWGRVVFNQNVSTIVSINYYYI